MMFRYFRELLQTLKLIEGHLEKLAACVGSTKYDYENRRPCVTTQRWNDIRNDTTSGWAVHKCEFVKSSGGALYHSPRAVAGGAWLST